ncbi:MAG: ATP-binding protein [Clostridia bacterium]|nr:ATP-binding protein [Clostridia bacterium]
MSDYIERSIEERLHKLAKAFPVIMITGSRQVGKTTLLNKIQKKENDKINYISLDNLSIRALAIEEPEIFLERYKPPLIIDEFQYAPKLLSYIKIIVDEKRQQHLENKEVEASGLYYLTGSQVFHTMKNVSESLAGRVGILELYPLSNREIEKKKDKMFLPIYEELEKREKANRLEVDKLYEKILKGSYPELYSNPNIEPKDFFETYIKTYIERDIRELINVKDETKFLKFIESIAVRTGQELNINDISNSIEINNMTAQNWLSILVSTGLVYLLQPYSNNNVSRIVKRPKIYFMDTGLACFLAGYMDSITLERSAFNGAILETYVVTEMIKSFSNQGLDSRKYLYYYRDNNGKEIDLIIIYNNKVYPLEIKKSYNPGKQAVKNFDVTQKFGMEIGNGGVICLTKDIFPIDKNNNLIPIELL